MKKNFILFALMVFLPVLAFAQSLSVTLGTDPEPTTYDGNVKLLAVSRNQSTYSYAEGNYGYQAHTYRIYKGVYNNGGNNVEVGADGIKDAGTYTVRGRGRSNNNYYTSTITVKPKSIADESVTVTPIANQPFTGQAIEPEFTVQDGSAELDGAESVPEQIPAGVDYTYEFSDNTQVGTATITIKGQGNYTGSREVAFSIYNPSENPSIFGKTVTFTFDGTPTYNGSEWYPATITIEGVGTLTKADRRGIPDYSGTENFKVVSVVNNINAGLATVTLEGKGDYEGQAQGTFQIAQQPLDDATITLAAASVEYNGTSTAVGINSVKDADGKTLVAGVDYLVYGYKYNAKTADTEAVPGHVGNWYVVVGPAAGSNYTAEAVSKDPFAVTKRALKIDLLEIHKTYGDDDPDLANIDINEWASINWAPGDGPSNTTISPIEFERLTVGENVYDENGNRNSFAYSLKNPSTLKAIANDGGWENYTVGVGQSSNLLIDKAPLTLNVTNYWKKFQAADPTSFEYTVVEGLKNGDKLADVKATVTRADGEAVNAHVEKQNNKDVVVLNDNEVGYAFEGVSNNYEISFNNAFAIIPTDDYSGIKVAVKNNVQGTPEFGKAEYVYRGTAYEPGKANTAEAADLIVTDGNRVLTTADYQVKSYANNVHAGTATVTVTLKGSYVGTDKLTTFAINKAPLKIKAVDYVLQPGQAYPEPLEVSYTGFVNNETPATAKNFSAPTGVEKEEISGTTAFTLKVKQDAKADDYKISYDDGALTFGETILNVYANNKSKIYSAKDPEFDVRVTAPEAPATDAQIALLTVAGKKVYTLSREEGEDVGTYTISIDGPTVLPEGVIVKYHEGEFAINVKTVYLRGDAVSKEYGEANPTFDASVWEDNAKWSDEKKAAEGVVNPNFYYVGVQGANWNGREWVLSSEDVTPANGGFVITPTVRTGWGTSNGITTSGNYYVEADATHSGKFTITPAPLTIAADEKSKFYGQTDPDLTVTVTGLKFRDALVAGTDYTISRKAGEDVGEYAIEVKTVQNSVNSGVLKNYKPITLTNGKFAIKAAALEIVANDQAIYYGQSINPYDVVVKIAGVDQRWNEEKIKAVLKLETEITKVGANKDAYTLVPANNPNYSIAEDAFTNGWLTINPLAEIPLDNEVAIVGVAEPIKLTQVLEDHKGVAVDVRMPSNRSFKKDTWYTFVLPFEIKVRDFSYALGYAVVDLMNEANEKGGNLALELTTSTIPANTPFTLKVDEDLDAEDLAEIVFEGKTIDAKADYTKPVFRTDAGGNTFYGTYEALEDMAINEYFIYLNSGKFYHGGHATRKFPIAQTEAYWVPKAGAEGNVRITIEEPNGTTTVIEGVDADAEAAAAEGWYTINGVKLEGEPTVSGTYIFNGKKVFIQK